MGKSHSRRLRGINLLGFIGSMVLAVGVILVSMRVWEMDLSTSAFFSTGATTRPLYSALHGWDASGDGILGSLFIKSLWENGLRGLWFNVRLGAPETAAFVDTPFFDLGISLQYFMLTRFFEPNTSKYLQYFLGYALCAGAMYLLLNRYTGRVLLKTLLSVAFAVAPYHFIRGMGHQSLSNYCTIPAFIYLADLIYTEDFGFLFPRRYRGSGVRKAVMLLSCVLVGIGNIYYAFAGVLCMMFACILKMIRTKKLRPLRQEGAAVLLVLLAVAVGLFPKVWFSIRNGANTMATVREPLEGELYGLKLIQMLLPPFHSRLSLLAGLNEKYTLNAFNINENLASALGLMGTCGFAAACGWLIWAFIMRKREESTLTARMDFLSLTVLMLVLYAVPGGFGTIVSYFITPEIRSVNRFSIVICCLSLLVICVGYDALMEKWQKGWKRRCLAGALLLVFVTGGYSEIPAYDPHWQAGVREEDAAFRSFFRAVENRLEPSAMVYELPFMSFPENPPIQDMKDYEPAMGYLYTEGIRWSYGGVRGRNHAAEDLNVDDGMSVQFVDGLVKAGFAGVYIDTNGYADRGGKILRFYREQIDSNPVVSEDGRLYFFDLRGAAYDEGKALPGVYFLESYAETTGTDVDNQTLIRYAQGLAEGSGETLDALWDWGAAEYTKAELSDRDYILMLYQRILSRDEPNPEDWVREMNRSGMTRKQVFESFFMSPEFREKNGFIQPEKETP